MDYSIIGGGGGGRGVNLAIEQILGKMEILSKTASQKLYIEQCCSNTDLCLMVLLLNPCLFLHDWLKLGALPLCILLFPFLFSFIR